MHIYIPLPPARLPALSVTFCASIAVNLEQFWIAISTVA